MILICHAAFACFDFSLYLLNPDPRRKRNAIGFGRAAELCGSESQDFLLHTELSEQAPIPEQILTFSTIMYILTFNKNVTNKNQNKKGSITFDVQEVRL